MQQMILNLHGIGMPKRPLEDGEAPYWITEDLYQRTVALAADLRPQVTVRFTFDDGNASDLISGAGELSRHGFSGIFFVLASRIDQPGSLSADDLHTLRRMGHHIGTHGADHVDWTQLDAEGCKREFSDARQKISDIIGAQVDQAAIPFGRYNRQVLSALRAEGYRKVYSSDKGPERTGQFPIPRTSLTSDMTLSTVHELLTIPSPLKTRFRRALAMEIKKRI